MKNKIMLTVITIILIILVFFIGIQLGKIIEEKNIKTEKIVMKKKKRY